MKLERLLNMVIYLLNREIVTGKSLAERYGVSERTIQRDINSLNEAGIPVVAIRGTHGGYQILETFKLRNHTQTPKDLERISFALKTIGTAIYDEDLNHIAEKYNAVFSASKSSLSMDLGMIRENDDIVKYLNLIEESISEQKKIVFDYCNARQERSQKIVEPISVHYKWYAWYMVGYSEKTKDYRIYKLARMTALKKTYQSIFTYHETKENIFDMLMQGDKRAKIDLVFYCSSQALPVVKEYLNCSRIRKAENGYIVSMEIIEEERYWFGILLSLGDQIKIIEPNHIKEKCIDHSKKIISMYKNTT